MRIDRRRFLQGAFSTAALTVVAGRAPVIWAGAPSLPADPFTLGVGSGDPLADGFVLWTRLAPAPLEGGGMPDAEVPVTWEVATDDGFADVVAEGSVTASPAFAHSVHVDVRGLEPDRWYVYRFSAGGFDSPVGRARTTPAGCDGAAMRFAFASCQSYASGYYTAHAALAAEEDVDVVLFLGDYIYEGGGSGVRTHPGGEAATLAAYRNRYALYRADADLQASHAARPWVVVWDDHEVENNYAGVFDENGGDPAAFLVRRADAYRAWWEHQAVRLPAPIGPDLAIFRRLDWGGLVRIHALDGRQYRSNQVSDETLVAPSPEMADPARTMLGEGQERWLVEGLEGSQTTWNVLANQVVFASMPLAGLVNPDQWDGYTAQRQRLIDRFGSGAVANPVIVTGDIHASGIAEIKADWADPDSRTVATELVGTSISSSFPAELVDVAERVIAGIPWVHYVNARQRGYTVCDVTHERLEATYRVVDTVGEPTSGVSTATTYTIEAGVPGACRAGGSDSTGGGGTGRDGAAGPVRATPTFTG